MSKLSMMRGQGSGWVSLTLFFHCLQKVGADESNFLTVGDVLTPEELGKFIRGVKSALQNKTLDKANKDAVKYINDIIKVLSIWSLGSKQLKII